MTSRLSHDAAYARTLEKFPDFPPRDDMQNSLHLDDAAHQAILRRRFGNEATTIVLSEIPVRWTPSQQEGHRVPDLLVAFNADRALGVEQRGYSIRDQGKPPDFVLEIASPTTARNDYVDKRRDYAAFGIPEYWRFDPTGGRRYGAPIAGDRLSEGRYRPIEIREVEPGHYHGYSEVLNLNPCWDSGRLRWHDPATQRHLLTFDEESEAHAAERAAHMAERAAHMAEREARMAERAARAAAEARVEELEAQLRARDQG